MHSKQHNQFKVLFCFPWINHCQTDVLYLFSLPSLHIHSPEPGIASSWLWKCISWLTNSHIFLCTAYRNKRVLNWAWKPLSFYLYSISNPNCNCITAFQSERRSLAKRLSFLRVSRSVPLFLHLPSPFPPTAHTSNCHNWNVHHSINGLISQVITLGTRVLSWPNC